MRMSAQASERTRKEEAFKAIHKQKENTRGDADVAWVFGTR